MKMNWFTRAALIAPLALVGHLANAASTIDWSGFGSAYYGQGFSKTVHPYGFTDGSPNFGSFSSVGLNIGAKLSDSLTFSSELNAANNLSTGAWGLQADWAFLTYDAGMGVKFKLGRQLLPVLMSSEYRYNHFMLPFRAVPEQVSTATGSSQFDGLTATWGMDSGAMSGLSVSIFGGRPVADSVYIATGTISADDKDLLGAAIDYAGTGWGVHLAASHQKNNDSFTSAGATPVTAAVTSDVTYMSAGYKFDKYNFVSWGEYVNGKSSDGTAFNGSTYNHSSSSGYVMLGYRIGSWLPRYTFASSNVDNGLFSGVETSHDVGVNYQVNSQAVVRLDYQLSNLPATDTSMYFTRDSGSGTSVSAVYAGVDFIF